MSGVKAARVHIVLPDAGSFRRGRQPPSASVIVRTEIAGRLRARRRPSAISSPPPCPGMTVDQVTVLNTDGTVLASGGDAIERRAEQDADAGEDRRARSCRTTSAKTLTPYLGLGNFEISVAARLNTDKRQTNETNYNPEQRVERSVRVVKETGSSQNSNTQGAAGVEQNVPAEQAASGRRRPVQEATTSAARSSTNYEVGHQDHLDRQRRLQDRER